MSEAPILQMTSVQTGRLPLARTVWSLLAALILGCLILSVEVQAGEDLEYVVKAGCLFNFTKFIEWPEDAFSSPDAPIVIGILGKDPFGRGLDEAIKSETSQGRPVVIRRFERVEDARSCHLLFVSASESRRFKEIVQGLKGTSVVTVGDTDKVVEQGGVIQLRLEKGVVRFIINMDAATRAKARVSSQLLRLAQIVDGKG